jgi:RNA polymerase sigma-70 factor, ECF subfamily
MAPGRTLADLYRTYGSTILRRARRILGDEADARDVVQEIFVQLVRDPTALTGADSPVAFLYRVTTNRCINRLRNENNRRRLLADEGERLAPEGTSDAEGRQRVRDLLRLLPDDLAAVVTYYYVDGMTHAEIAEIIGCSRRQVGLLLERMHERLRAQPEV